MHNEQCTLDGHKLSLIFIAEYCHMQCAVFVLFFLEKGITSWWSTTVQYIPAVYRHGVDAFERSDSQAALL